MDIQAKDTSATGGSLNNSQQSKSAPAANDVSAFNKAMGGDKAGSSNATGSEGASCQNCPGCPACSGGEKGADNSPLNDPKMKEVLGKVLELVQLLLEKVQSGELNTKGGSIRGPGNEVSPVEGTGPGGSAPTSNTPTTGGKIPKPTEHVQELNLGGKTVTVGGDGTSSKAEVEETARSMEQMYQNSPTFKNMIDNSSDPSFEVSVGKRSDNTSWGASDGRLFMNTNNIKPGNSDAWQSLLAHEVAHASIDLGHGSEMKNLERKVAQEA